MQTSEIENLKNFIPTPHHSYVIFKRNSIPIAAVAEYLNLSYGYLNSILTGTRKATQEISDKLTALAKEVEKN